MSGRIGILDSGVGGLTVVKEVFRQLPNEAIVYVGDSARCPYGPRPNHEIRCFSHQLIQFLMKFDVKALVIACNTATAVVLDEVRKISPIPVVGVIEPGARAAIRATQNKRVGVIGTTATIQSGMYEKVLRRTHSDLEMISLACPAFVPLVEAGNIPEEQALRMISEALEPLQDTGMDTLILGCTHYPLIAHLIQKVVGDGVTLISSAEETASEVSAILSHKQLLQKEETNTEPLFFTTGNTLSFQSIAENWLQRSIKVQHVNLEQETSIEHFSMNPEVI